MSNLNLSLLKDYVVFADIDPSTTYFLQSWDGLGITGADTTSGSPYGPVYNPSNILIYNTIAFTFLLDEDYKVFETIQDMLIKNGPVDGSAADPVITTIDLHLMNNTYKKEVGYIRLYDAYVQSIMNVQQNYSLDDNTTPPKTMQAVFKYQYHKFYRNDEGV